MFVQDIESGLRLSHRNEFLCSLSNSLAWRAFLLYQSDDGQRTLSTFSGLMCGGGGIVTYP